MTDIKTTRTPEEDAAAEEAAVNARAAADLKAQGVSDAPLRMTDDVYVGIVGMARRYHQGKADIAAVQTELDAVFGPGKVAAADVVTEPEVVEPQADSIAKPTTRR